MKEKKDSIVNPIYEWLDSDIWDYIKQQNIKVNPLYERGYPRVGCIGCPLAGYKQKLKEFSDYPKYKALYIKAFDKMIQERKERGMETQWTSGQECFDWWLEIYKYEVKGQMNIFDYMEGK